MVAEALGLGKSAALGTRILPGKRKESRSERTRREVQCQLSPKVNRPLRQLQIELMQSHKHAASKTFSWCALQTYPQGR